MTLTVFEASQLQDTIYVV